jgi:hypothetical protein
LSPKVIEIIAKKSQRNLDVTRVLNEILIAVHYFQFVPRKKHSDLRRKRRKLRKVCSFFFGLLNYKLLISHKWKDEIITLNQAQFYAQFLQRKMKVIKKETEAEPTPTEPLPSPKSKQELLMKKEAESEENLYPRARIPPMVPSARFSIGHYESIGRRPLMVRIILHMRFPSFILQFAGRCYADTWHIPWSPLRRSFRRV